MDEEELEGTLVLEQLGAIDKVEDFFDAVDSDDIERVMKLMRQAKVDTATIAVVVRKIRGSGGEH